MIKYTIAFLFAIYVVIDYHIIIDSQFVIVWCINKADSMWKFWTVRYTNFCLFYYIIFRFCILFN